ncbi:MAG: hypothetical protein V3V05_11555 [Pontiella sp.]
MKYCVLFISIILAASCASAEPRKKTTFHVTDAEIGVALTNAQVTVYNKGWDTKKVDENGICVFEGFSSPSKSMGWAGHTELDGYYKNSSKVRYTEVNRILNRWEPWNSIVEVKLRKIKKPLPMVAKRIESLDILEWNKPVGFDLEKADWIAPHGKGHRSDFYVNMYRRFEHSGDFDAVATITFPNDGDGIQLYRVPAAYTSSSYKFPYEAPTDAYQSKFVLECHATLRETKASFDRKTDRYIFRVRTEKDKEGNIISACYGRIGGIEIGWGDVLDFSYYFNPVPNECSLEYNGENLLKK